MKIAVGEIAAMLNGYVEGDNTIEVSTFAPIDEADEGALTFLSNPKYNQYLYETKATAVLISEDFQLEKPVKPVLIRVKDVYSSLSVLLDVFKNTAIGKTGIEQPSHVSESAQVGDDVYIGAFAYIGDNVKLGKSVKIYPQSYIGDNVTIGEGTIIYAGVKVYAGNVIGKDCIIHSGAVIGSDGFGFAPQSDGKFKKVPQTGNVVVKDNVEIGANTTIDRATLKSTILESGVKLDNLIQIAHNVEVGENTAIAAQAGISGSTKLGANCLVGGQVGVVGHITIAKGSQIGAQSGVAKAITEEGKKWFGSPAVEATSAIRAQAVFKKLPEIYLKLNNLEQEFRKIKNS